MNDNVKQILSYPLYRQSIEISEGYSTPGLVNKQFWDFIGLPKSLEGKSFLDVGSNDGLFSFEADRRGAIKVVASDLYKDNIDTMKNGWDNKGILMLKDLFNSKIEIHNNGVYSLDELDSKFDVVLVNHIINWLDDIELAVQQLSAATNGTLYISDGFILDNDLPKKIIPKNMPMRFMYNLKFMSELLIKNGFLIDSIREVNIQEIFIQNYVKYPKVIAKKGVRIYKLPVLNESYSISDGFNEIANHKIGKFHHINQIGWVYEADVEVKYFQPSFIYKFTQKLGIEFLYYAFLKWRHKRVSKYSAYVIKATKA